MKLKKMKSCATTNEFTQHSKKKAAPVDSMASRYNPDSKLHPLKIHAVPPSSTALLLIVREISTADVQLLYYARVVTLRVAREI